MILKLALYLEIPKEITTSDYTPELVSGFTERVLADGGVFEGDYCLNKILYDLGGYSLTSNYISDFKSRVITDGGTYEAGQCLYDTLIVLGGFTQTSTQQVFERVDLFADESVSLTQVIQDVKDISKIFTEFSKTFSLPANEKNNRIFKHYYNYDIDNYFDARFKINAYIEIDNVLYNTGKIKLEGVDLKNGQPNNYRITYFGSTVNLKDVIGEDKLNALDLSQFNLAYNNTNVKAKLQVNPSANDVIVPFISHTTRYFLDSSSGHSESDVSNLNYHSGAGNNHGLLWSDLKYALRISKIVEAIQIKYNLNFSNDFFNNANLDYYNLFMWLHRVKGDVQSATFGNNPPQLIDAFTPTTDTCGGVYMLNESTLKVIDNSLIYSGELRLNTISTGNYKVSIYRNGTLIYQSADLTGNQVINTSVLGASLLNGDYTLYVQSQSIISFSLLEWYFSVDCTFSPIKRFQIFDFNLSGDFLFDISQQIPDIKVIDFLTGLFKMFNLTAYVDNGTIIVKSLNEFYNTFDIYDVSQYVISDSKSIDVALPFKQVSFGYEDTNALLALKHNQLFSQEWAKEKYQSELGLAGDTYEISLPFSHMKYERIIDLNGNVQSDIQWGYSATDNFNSSTGNYESYIGKPLLFYPILVSGVSDMSFRDTISTHTQITSYIAPSNSLYLSSATDSTNINFKQEINEWTSDTTFENTLFKKHYENYILEVFDPKNRLTKIKAILPLKILTKFKLNDRFKISDRLFKINKITTNLTNGESDIELLNEL